MKFELSQFMDIIERGLEILGEESCTIPHLYDNGASRAPWVYGGASASTHLDLRGIKVFQIEREIQQTLDIDIRILRLGIVEKEQEE